ncbi:MAG: tripartite ATP-independent periplasmic transporter DctQ [Hyphomicrobiales bacterium]|nr:tripartite ATP-independent periplasmic transporter DctQ [Hyphomicrobiales bacterium]
MTGVLLQQATAPPIGWRGQIVRMGDAVSRVCTIVAAVALGIIVAINGANVFGRYFLSAPLNWAEEAMLYLMVVTVFAGAASVTWRQQHIKIDAIVSRMPAGAQAAAIAAMALVTLAVLSMAVYASFLVVDMLRGFDQRSEALEIPMWIPQSIVTIGLSLTGLLFLMRSVCAIGMPPAASDDGAGR